MVRNFTSRNFQNIHPIIYIHISTWIMICVLLSVLKTNFLYLDDVRIAAQINNSVLGRPLYDYIFSLFYGTVLIDASPAHQVLSLVLLATSSYLLLKSLQININIFYACISAVIIGRYGMLEMISYKLDSLMYTLAIFFAVSSFYTIHRDTKYTIYLSSGLLCCSIFLYQSAIIVYIIGILFSIKHTITSENKINFMPVLPLGICGIIYYLYLTLFASLCDYAIELSKINIDFVQISNRIHKIITNYIEFNIEQAALLALFCCILCIYDIIKIFSSSQYTLIHKCTKGIFILLLYILLIGAQYIFTILLSNDWPSLLPRASHLHGIVLFIVLCRIGEKICKDNARFIYIIVNYIIVVKIIFLVNFYGNMLTIQDTYVKSIMSRAAPVINKAYFNLKLNSLCITNSIGLSPIVKAYVPHHKWLVKLIPVHIPKWWSMWEIQYFNIKPNQILLDNPIIQNSNTLKKEKQLYAEEFDFILEYDESLLFLTFTNNN